MADAAHPDADVAPRLHHLRSRVVQSNLRGLPLHCRRGVLEQGLKPREDVSDCVPYSVHESRHGLLVEDGPRLLDLYLERKISLEAHITFGWSSGCHEDAHLYAASAQPFGPLVDHLEFARSRVDDLPAEARSGRDFATEIKNGCVEYPVLVDVRQLVQVPQGVRLWRVPSKVRLAPPDLASMVRKQAVEMPDGLFLEVPVRLTQVFTTIGEDRKADLAHLGPVVLRFSRWAPGDGELPRDVVQAGAKVVSDVSEKEAPSVGRWLPLDVANVLAKLRVVLVQDSVRVAANESRNVFVQSIDVCACPTELESSAV